MLSENPNFARSNADHGFKFIGPKCEHIEKMANKIEANQLLKVGLPILPGSRDNVLNY